MKLHYPGHWPGGESFKVANRFEDDSLVPVEHGKVLDPADHWGKRRMFHPGEHEVAAVYDQKAEEFFKARKRTHSLELDAVLWPKIALAMNGVLEDGGSVLDVGTGSGYLIYKILSSRGMSPDRIMGIDISEGMLRIAQEQFAERENVQLMQMSASRMDGVEDASFDVVVSMYAMDYLVDPQQGLREVARVLKPGGRFVFLVPHQDRYQEYYELGGGQGRFPEGVYDETFGELEGITVPKWYWRTSTWSNKITQAGLIVRYWYEPHPDQDFQYNAPDVWEKYERGNRAVVFDALKPVNGVIE